MALRFAPLGIIHHAGGEILLACYTAAQREPIDAQARESGGTVEAFADYDSLRDAVHIRANIYLAEALAPAFDPTAEWPDPPEPFSPLVLLHILAISEGTLPSPVVTTPPTSAARQREIFASTLTLVVQMSLDTLLRQAFQEGGPQTVLDRIDAAIPVECLTAQATREALSQRCVDWTDDLLADDPDAAKRSWRYEYLNAAAHAAAGIANPRGAQWATTHLAIFLLSRNSHALISPEFLLDAAVLRRTIRFADAWEVSAAGRDPRELANTDIPGWFEFIGMADELIDELRNRPLRYVFDGVNARTDDAVAAALFDYLIEAHAGMYADAFNDARRPGYAASYFAAGVQVPLPNWPRCCWRILRTSTTS